MLNLGDFVNYYGYSVPSGCRPAVVWEIFSRETPQGEKGPITVSLRNVDDHNDTIRVKNAHTHLHLFKVVGSRDKSGNPLRIGDAVVFSERGRSQQGVIRGLDSNGFFIVETPNRNLRVETGRNLRKAGPLHVDRDGTPLYVGDSVTLFTELNPEIGEVGKIVLLDPSGKMKIQTATGTYVGNFFGAIQKIKQESTSGVKQEVPILSVGDLVKLVNASDADTWRVTWITVKSGRLHLRRVGDQKPEFLYGVIPSSVILVRHESEETSNEFQLGDVVKFLPEHLSPEQKKCQDWEWIITGKHKDNYSLVKAGESVSNLNRCHNIPAAWLTLARKEETMSKPEPSVSLRVGSVVTLTEKVPYCDPSQLFTIREISRDGYELVSIQNRNSFGVTLSRVKPTQVRVATTAKFPYREESHVATLRDLLPGDSFYFFTRNISGEHVPDETQPYVMLESPLTKKSRYVSKPNQFQKHVLVYNLKKGSLHFRDETTQAFVVARCAP